MSWRPDTAGFSTTGLWLAALALSACDEPHSIVVTVASRPSVVAPEVAELEVTLSGPGANAARKSQTFATGGAEFPLTFSITPGDEVTSVDIAVRAVAADGRQMATGTTTALVDEESPSVLLAPSDFVINTDVIGEQVVADDFDVVGYQIAGSRDRVTFGFRNHCIPPMCELAGRRFDRAGRPMATELAASTNQFPWHEPGSAQFASELALAATADGGSVAVWEAPDQQVLCRGLAANGVETRQTAILTATTADLLTATTLTNSNIVVTWVTREAGISSIRAMVVDAQCGVVVPTYDVATPVQQYPRTGVAAAAHGILYVWTDDGDLHYRLGPAAGGAGGSTALLAAGEVTLPFEYGRPVALPDGFAVALSTHRVGTTEFPISLRRLDRVGANRGSDTRIGTASGLTPPAIAHRADGAVAVAWASTVDGDGAGQATLFRLLRSTGLPVGPVIVANTTTAGNQYDPGVAAIDDAFVVSFTDASNAVPDTAGTSVRARFLYPPFDDARGVIGAVCQRADFPDCGAGTYCIADATNQPRCHARCDFAAPPPQCGGGGVCTLVDGVGVCLFGD